MPCGSEQGNNGNVAYIADYVYANGQKIARLTNSIYGGTTTANYYLDDHLGTTQVELDAFGNVTWQGQFTPFGAELPDGSTAMHYKFTGKERDTESGLDYFSARYYSSDSSRFMSPDWAAKAEPVPYAKLDNPQTLNLYNYVKNNPLSRADDDGHCDICQKFLNVIKGNGFQTNAELADQKTLEGLQNGTITTRATYTPIVTNESSEPNQPVALVADVVGAVTAAADLKVLGTASAIGSSINDSSPQNVTTNALAAALVDVSEVGQAIAATSLVKDVGQRVGDFITDVALKPAVNSLPPQKIDDGSEHTIPNPALQDQTDPRP